MKKLIYYVLLLTILVPGISLFSENTTVDTPNPICDLLPSQGIK